MLMGLVIGIILGGALSFSYQLAFLETNYP